METEIQSTKSVKDYTELEIGNFYSLVHTEDSQIQEIISHRSPTVVRWGTFFILIIVLIIGIVSWVVRYPDIVISKGILSSINAPKEILAKSDGRLIKIFMHENKQVKEGDVLGYLESTGDHQEILRLSKKLDELSLLLNGNGFIDLKGYTYSQFENLGELQESFQIYIQSLFMFSNYLAKGYYIRKREMLIEDCQYLVRIHESLVKQESILSLDLSLSDSTFRATEQLRNQKVISSVDYRSEKSKLLAKAISIPQISSLIVNNENLQHEKRKEIAELENRIQQQKGIFIQELNSFKSQINKWKSEYLLIAPLAGVVSFATFIQENQQVRAGQLICYINPGNINYYVEVKIPQYNFGKVRVGQSVLLKFAAYPYQEFGTVLGHISAINSMPTDSGFFAKISLPLVLETNYRKLIQYRTGLSVSAEILTQNRRLIRRLFENMVVKKG